MPEVKERPIAFSAPMVRAILEGRKTQTRRVMVKPRVFLGATVRGDWPIGHTTEAPRGSYAAHMNPQGAVSVLAKDGKLLGVKPAEFEWACPYGRAGERLWVREAWGYRGSHWFSGRPKVRDHFIEYRADGAKATYERAADDEHGLPKQVCRCKGEGDELDRHLEHDAELTRYWASWRTPMFMPRWASRITLEVVDVRVERVQAITEEDAKAEVVEPQPIMGTPGYVAAYSYLWDALNAERGHSWASNPWVWCVSFRRLA